MPDAGMALHAQNHDDRPLDGSVTEESAGNGGAGPPRSPAPGLECWNRRSPRPPEVLRPLPDCDRALLPGPGSGQESPMHRVPAGQPGGPSSCPKTTYMPSPRKGRPYPLQDGPVTQGDLDSSSPTSEEDFVPRPVPRGELWRAGDPGRGTLSLSDRVERNRLLLQEMLSTGGQGPSKAGTPAWTSSWDGAAPGKAHSVGLDAGGDRREPGRRQGDWGCPEGLSGRGLEHGCLSPNSLACPLLLGFDVDS